MWPAEDRAKKSAPASRTTLSTRPLQSLPCPRMSSTTMIKDGAHLASARQTRQKNSQGEHANEPCELQGSCPSGAASLRQRVTLIRKTRAEPWQHKRAAAPQKEPIMPFKLPVLTRGAIYTTSIGP